MALTSDGMLVGWLVGLLDVADGLAVRVGVEYLVEAGITLDLFASGTVV